MSTATCGACQHFTPPLPIYEPNSIGECQIMEAWLNKFPQRRPPPREYNKNYATLGGKVWMPKIERYCSKFKAS